RAGRQVNRHTPAAIWVGPRLVHRQGTPANACCLRGSAFLFLLAGEARRMSILLQGAGTDDLAVMHQVVLLSAGHQGCQAGLLNRQPGSEPGTVRRAEGVGIKADGLLGSPANTSRVILAITEIYRDRVVGVTRHDPDRRSHPPVTQPQL